GSRGEDRPIARGNERGDRAAGKRRHAERSLLALDAAPPRERRRKEAHPARRALARPHAAPGTAIRSGPAHPLARSCRGERGRGGGGGVQRLIEFINEAPWKGEPPDERFSEMAIQSFRLQCERIPDYGAYARHVGKGPDQVGDWREIPPVPVSAFRSHD